ncbi:MAG: hypothetical protein FJ029_03280 [Actinobacteria bacterium]|nr:hypothetical protein [Actinomycetota bacterium]
MSVSEAAAPRLAPRLAELASRLVRPGLLRDQVALLVLSMVVNVLAFAFQFVMARLLEPPAYAEMFAVLSLLALVGVPSQALNTLAVKITGELFVHGRGAQLWSWVVTALTRIGVAGLAIAVLVGLLSGLIRDTFQLSGVGSVLAAGMAIALSYVVVVVKGALAGTRHFVALGVLSVAETAVRLGAGVLLVYLGLAAAGAVGATAVAALFAALAGAVAVRRTVRHGVDHPEAPPTEPPGWADQTRILLISLALAAMFNLDVLFVKHFFGESDAARYSAIALVGRTIFFAAAPVSLVLLPHSIRAFSTGRSVAPGLLLSLGLILAIVGVAVAVILTYPAQVFAVLFGGRYEPDASLLWIYALAGTLLSVTVVLAQLQIGVGHLTAWRALTLITAAMVGGMVAFHGSLAELAGVLAVAAGVAAAYLGVHTAILVRRVDRAQGMGRPAKVSQATATAPAAPSK